MSSKGDRSRENILRIARMLFAAKGFSAVTMQDICQGTGLSRGGLYRHYGSTSEIFAAIIQQEQRLARAALERAVEAKVKPRQILVAFLRSRAEQLLDPACCIDRATAEFAAVDPEGKALLRKRAADSVEILAQILRMGIESGDLRCPDPERTALHILWFLEGMGRHNALLPLGKEEAFSQLQAVLAPLMRDSQV